MDAPFTERLQAATNAHDLEAIVACFADDYVNETPCHPARGFAGREQVRANWTTILAAVPDLRADVLAVASGPGVEWSEWELRGTRRDGSSHLMRGVMVFTTDGVVARRCRFFLEPVGASADGVDAAVARHVGNPADR
jgi:ketosteroid isomerase-like protein